MADDPGPAPLAADDELARLDALGQAELVANGTVTARELVEAAIARIERLDPHLNAVISRNFDAALGVADSMDAPITGPTGGHQDTPFRGVPFLLKDLWPSSAGDPMHLGVKALRVADYRHGFDSNIVKAYRRAGFIIAGRTNTPELGLVATTEPEAYGATHNPWHLDHSPGGSSGGAAAAVAARLVPIANASDGGGSIRIPASSCGLIGLKPSRGRMSMGPTQDEWGLSVQHVVCHTMRDCAAALDATAIAFNGDGVIAPDHHRPWLAHVGSEVRRLRIGLLPESLTMETEGQCTEAAQLAAQQLESLGHHVELAHPPALADLARVSEAFGLIWAVNAKMNLGRISTMLGREVTADDVEPGTWLLASLAERRSAIDLAQAQAVQHTFRRAVLEWWAQGWDLLLSPTAAIAPPRLGTLVSRPDDPLAAFRESAPLATFTSWVNTTGQPAISLPGHLTREGLPIGVQLVADYGREDLLIAVGSQLLGHHR